MKPGKSLSLTRMINDLIAQLRVVELETDVYRRMISDFQDGCNSVTFEDFTTAEAALPALTLKRQSLTALLAEYRLEAYYGFTSPLSVSTSNTPVSRPTRLSELAPRQERVA